MGSGGRRRPYRLGLGVGCCLLVAISSLTAVPADGRAQRVSRVFTIRSPEITESSSLAVSTVRPRLVYTTNDSGDAATVYVLRARDGEVVGRTRLAGVTAVDVEAISAGNDGRLVVADIGDNDADRSTVRLYRIPQPLPGRREVAAEAVTASYAGGPRDAEAVVYDARRGRVFVVSKQLFGGAVYATPADVFDGERSRLRAVARAPSVATDATALPDGRHAVVRTYLSATVYRLPEWQPVRRLLLPEQRQGESITAPAGGGAVWVGSEGVRSVVLSVPLPRLPGGGEPPTPPESSGVSTSGAGVDSTPAARADSGSADAGNGRLRNWSVLAGAGLVALAVAVAASRLRRRRRTG